MEELEAIHHVQVAIPAGGEEKGRYFYGDLLGLREVPKPLNLAARGGVWFSNDGVVVHLGVDPMFVPARKAHVAFRVHDLEAFVSRMQSAGAEIVTDEPLEGYERVYVFDPFGNRLEFLQPMAPAHAYWLMKSEPGTFSIDHLEAKGVEHWDGVRNYAARNHLTAMKVGDLAFFYHSSADPTGVAGICEIVREAYPDHTQFDPMSKYFDPKASEAKPRWFMPDVRFVRKFARVVTLSEIRQTPGLEDMQLVRFGRLSVQSVSEKQWDIICDLASA